MTSSASSPTVTNYEIALITIPEKRQREKAEADSTLISSIEQQGLLNPIVLHADGTLVAGERRLDAHRKLGRTHIRATIFETLTLIQQHEIELMENLARKQLTWQEEVKAIGGYHSIRVDAHPGWTQMGTSTALGLSASLISRYLAIYSCIDDESIMTCPTMQGALNALEARAQRARIAAANRGLDIGTASLLIPPAHSPGATREERSAALLSNLNLNQKAGATIEEVDKKLANIQAGRIAEQALVQEKARNQTSDLILHADFSTWVRTYEGERFDVLHLDFPYGKNYSGARTRRTGDNEVQPVYDDSPDIFFTLTEVLLSHADRIAYPAAHIIFWFDMAYYQWTVDAFTAAGWSLVQPFPLIWTKNNEGVAADPKRRPRHCYETALVFARGDRKISRLVVDHFNCGLDEKLHLNQKPLTMLKHFLSLVVDEHTSLLDPTCGSGSALVAAKQLKAQRVLGLELDENNVQVAKFLLQRHMIEQNGGQES